MDLCWQSDVSWCTRSLTHFTELTCTTGSWNVCYHFPEETEPVRERVTTDVTTREDRSGTQFGGVRFMRLHWVLCCCLLAKWCPTLCDPMDCSTPGSSPPLSPRISNNSKWSNRQRLNLKNIEAAHAAQFQKNKWPNQKMGQRAKQTFL